MLVLQFALCLLLLGAQPVAHPDMTLIPSVDNYLHCLSGFGYSGTVLIVKNGKAVLDKGYGLADREAGVPCRPNTVYEIGSLAKQFTATAIMKLEARGKLSLSDTIGKYFPGAPEDKSPITIEELLTHSSGLGSLQDEYPAPEISRDTWITRVFALPLTFPTGTRKEYSNEGYGVLAAIVDKVSALGFQGYCRSELFGPAGMKETGWWGSALPRVAKFRIAKGYDWNHVAQDLEKWSGTTWDAMGSGAVTSTVHDLWRWHRALLSGKIIPIPSLKRMWTVTVKREGWATDYGYGWFVSTSKMGVPMIHHGGDGWAFGSELRYFPSENLLVISLANVRHNLYPTQIKAGYVIQKILWDEPYEQPPTFSGSHTKSVSEAVGTYKLDTGGLIVVQSIQGRLHIGALGQDAIDVIDPVNATEQRLRSELNSFAVRVFADAEKGEFASLDEALGGNRHHPYFIAGWKGESAALRKDRGKELAITALGTYKAFYGRNTLLRFQYELGSSLYFIRWTEDRVLIESTMETPVLAALVPLQAQSPSQLVGWNLKEDKGLTVDVVRKGGVVSAIRVTTQNPPATTLVSRIAD